MREGVTIVGLTNLPSTMPFHASQLYARNVSALLHHLAPEGDAGARLGGRDHRRRLRDPQAGGAGMSHNTLLVFELTILVLAIFLGFEVISKVPTLLHTPLMSGTNAIHGIVVVGAMVVLGAPHKDTLRLDRRLPRRRARLRQRRRRLRRHRPHARDVQAARARERGGRLPRRLQ